MRVTEGACSDPVRSPITGSRSGGFVLPSPLWFHDPAAATAAHLICKPRVIATSCERQIKQIRGGESGYHVRMSMSEEQSSFNSVLIMRLLSDVLSPGTRERERVGQLANERAVVSCQMRSW